MASSSIELGTRIFVDLISHVPTCMILDWLWAHIDCTKSSVKRDFFSAKKRQLLSDIFENNTPLLASSFSSPKSFDKWWRKILSKLDDLLATAKRVYRQADKHQQHCGQRHNSKWRRQWQEQEAYMGKWLATFLSFFDMATIMATTGSVNGHMAISHT